MKSDVRVSPYLAGLVSGEGRKVGSSLPYVAIDPSVAAATAVLADNTAVRSDPSTI